jgi:hypothetical protein
MLIVYGIYDGYKICIGICKSKEGVEKNGKNHKTYCIYKNEPHSYEQYESNEEDVSFIEVSKHSLDLADNIMFSFCI